MFLPSQIEERQDHADVLSGGLDRFQRAAGFHPHAADVLLGLQLVRFLHPGDCEQRKQKKRKETVDLETTIKSNLT